MVTMYIAIYYLLCRKQANFFANREKINQSVADAIFLNLINHVSWYIFYFIMTTYDVAKVLKTVAMMLFIGVVSYQGITHFAQQNYDDQVSFAFGQKISLRAIIVSKSFDLIIWFTYQFVVIFLDIHKGLQLI